MIQASIAPRQLEADRPAELVVRLTNVGQGLCTNLVFRIELPVQLVLLRGSDRIEVARLEAGASVTSSLSVKPLKAGTWALTSPNFSYQDPRGHARRIADFRLEVRVVPATRPEPGTTPGREEAATAAQGIFISYRHHDTGLAAGLLAARLRRHLDRDQVFRDLDSTEPGVDFRKAIGDALGACAVALVLIGPIWDRVTDDRGRRRLDNPDDYVRVEVEAVLARDLRVIPVLVGGASMPRPDVLPGSLAELVYRQAAQLRNEPVEQFEDDLERLVGTLVGLVRGRR
jgi:TIR domain